MEGFTIIAAMANDTYIMGMYCVHTVNGVNMSLALAVDVYVRNTKPVGTRRRRGEGGGGSFSWKQ